MTVYVYFLFSTSERSGYVKCLSQISNVGLVYCPFMINSCHNIIIKSYTCMNHICPVRIHMCDVYQYPCFPCFVWKTRLMGSYQTPPTSQIELLEQLLSFPNILKPLEKPENYVYKSIRPNSQCTIVLSYRNVCLSSMTKG